MNEDREDDLSRGELRELHETLADCEPHLYFEGGLYRCSMCGSLWSFDVVSMTYTRAGGESKW